MEGKYVNLRNVKVEDAEFILSLRCNEEKSKFLHKTEYDIEEQIEYIKHCLDTKNEWYFIIENKTGKSIGTYRIYDVKKDSFCIGSWLLVDGTPAEEMLESDYLVREFGFNTLKMNKIHFDVRKGNKKVIRYHKMMGATIVDETELDYLFECTRENYMQNIKNYINI